MNEWFATGLIFVIAASAWSIGLALAEVADALSRIEKAIKEIKRGS